MWPDSDDILDKNNVKNKVEFLEKHTEFGVVISQTKIVNENDINNQEGLLQRIPPLTEDNIFEDAILDKNIYFAPCGYMARSSAFIDTHPQMQIYESRAGQNWQMVLPIFYKYKCGYLNQILATYVNRKLGHSRKKIYYEENLQRLNEQKKLLVAIIENMNIPNKEIYYSLIAKRFSRTRMYLTGKL